MLSNIQRLSGHCPNTARNSCGQQDGSNNEILNHTGVQKKRRNRVNTTKAAFYVTERRYRSSITHQKHQKTKTTLNPVSLIAKTEDNAAQKVRIQQRMKFSSSRGPKVASGDFLALCQRSSYAAAMVSTNATAAHSKRTYSHTE